LYTNRYVILETRPFVSIFDYRFIHYRNFVMNFPICTLWTV